MTWASVEAGTLVLLLFEWNLVSEGEELPRLAAVAGCLLVSVCSVFTGKEYASREATVLSSGNSVTFGFLRCQIVRGWRRWLVEPSTFAP